MRAYWRFLVPAVITVVVLILLGFNLTSSLVYFNTPTELIAEDPGDSRLRLGGQVVSGTLTTTTEGVTFEVTDGRRAVRVPALRPAEARRPLSSYACLSAKGAQ